MRPNAIHSMTLQGRESTLPLEIGIAGLLQQ
jgi:hypothetical protein